LPKRSPENFVPFSKTGSNTTITTPKKPIIIPIDFGFVSLSLNNIKRNKLTRSGETAYITWEIVAVVVFSPKIKRIMFKDANKDNGVSFHNDLKAFFLRRNGKIKIPAIKNRIKANVKGGILTRPIFVTGEVAPPNIDTKSMQIRAFCLSVML
jgi:hypothetical protein